jgi:hypothetical protein
MRARTLPGSQPRRGRASPRRRPQTLPLFLKQTNTFFIYFSIIIPAVIYFFFPKIIFLLTGRRADRDHLLTTACLLFFISWYLPTPSIDGYNTAFTTHFVGGGIFSGLLWLYIRKQLQIKFSAVQNLLAILMLTAMLGTANELLELLLTQLGIVQLTPADTWWDLLANTLGGLFVWTLYSIFKILHHKN